MKKYGKIVSMFMIIFIVAFSFCNIFAASTGDVIIADNGFGNGFDPSKIPNGNIDDVGKTKGVFGNIYTTILFFIQMASVAGIIVCGIRYMYSSSDTKADIKKSMLPLVIGIVLVFSASTVAQFVVKIFEDVAK